MTDMRAACVIGWPAAHSRSPLIHKHWLEEFGIAGDYRIEPVPPDEFATFVSDLVARGYTGANVTIPHKEQALTLAQADARASAAGAANTLWLDGGVLRATNTDIEGFIANLDASAAAWDTATDALVLGAGGGARAAIYGLLERGIARVHVANRTRAKGEAMTAQFGARVQALDWSEIPALLPAIGLLVNTTSLGMAGQPPLDIDVGLLPLQAVVADIVYVPLRTPLLVDATARGLRTADGLGMLLHQAVRGFSLWFGQTPEVTPRLRALVEADLARR